MDNKINTKNEAVEVDLNRLWRAVLGRIWIVCIAAIACAAITLGATIYLITPKYQSSAVFYVNNSSISMGDTSLSITSGDINASKDLVNTYAVILQSRTCLNDVIDYADLAYSYTELRSMISTSSVNNTEVFQVVVTAPDAKEAETIANAIAYILPNQITDIVEGTSAKIVDYAVVAPKPSSPDYTKNTILGFLIGLGLSVGLIVLYAMQDVTIRTEEDIEQCTNLPILAAIPDMEAPSKGGYYATESTNKKKKKSSDHKKSGSSSSSKKPTIGRDINFAATEAYKLLRTKLQFSFVDEVKCPTIGVTSAMVGEGKSLSAVNIAYFLSQLDKKVLLIDCDMRRPSLSKKLNIKKNPGLSEFLTGQNEMDDVIQICKIDDGGSFATVSSGRNPPNPIELLSSAKMAKAVEQLRDYFDYIILDLPPVGAVSDALVVAKIVDGILLVARQDYCNTKALAGAVNQFDFVESRLLGILLNCVGDHTSGYRYGYSKKYHKRYYRQYRYDYGYATPKAQAPQNTEKKD